MAIPMNARKYAVDGFRPFVLSMIQLRPGGENKASNLLHTREMIRKASEATAKGDGAGVQKPDLIMLPEMFNSTNACSAYKRHAEVVPDWSKGQVIERADLPSIEVAPTCHALSEAAAATATYIIGGSFPERSAEVPERIYNCLTVWDPKGRLIGKYRKTHLYDVDIPGGITYFESATITPGDQTLVLQFPFGTIAFGICYDIRFGTMIAALRESDPEICAYLLPAAFNCVTGPKAWEVLQRVRAIDNQIYVGMCAPARDTEAEYVSWGHSLVCDPEGKVISTPTPEDESETIIRVTLDPAKLIGTRQGLPVFSSQRTDLYSPPRLLR